MNLKKNGVFLIMLFTWTLAQAQVKSGKEIVEEAKSKISQISIEELKKKIDAKIQFMLIDVRSEKEYLAGHIEGAILIPRGELEFDIQKLTNDPEAEIIVYCRSGGRSALAVGALNDIGFKKVFNLDGGFKKWVSEGNSAFNMHGEIKVINFEKEEKKYPNIDSSSENEKRVKISQ